MATTHSHGISSSGAARQPEEQYIHTQLVTQKIPRARAAMMAIEERILLRLK